MANDASPKIAASTVPNFVPHVGEASATADVGHLAGVPRCSFRLQKTNDGCNIFCVGEDSIGCAVMQSLSPKIPNAQFALSCMQRGEIKYYCAMSDAASRVECTGDGISITLSGSPPIASRLHLAGDTLFAYLDGTNSCYVLLNGMPICMGSSLAGEPAVAADVVDSVFTSKSLSAEEELNKLRQAMASLSAERDVYRRAALKSALAEISQEDIQRYSHEEPGLPLEDFFHELENPRGR